MLKRKIVITGAGTGLGKYASIELARRGHTVYAATKLKEECTYFKEIANKENLHINSFKMDILKKEDLQKLEKIEFDTLINNAAIGDSGSVMEIHINRFKNIFETNVLANINITQIAIKKFMKKKEGKIIFLSSLAGIATAPFLSPYCTSKFAIESFVKSLRLELKLLKNVNIKIKIIEPGAYKTGFNQKMYKRKYEWMKNHSYFKNNLDYIMQSEEKLWDLIELKKFNSIIKQYVKAVESNSNKFKYTAPKLQVFFIKLYKIIELLFSM